ncbi:hypothetical protein GCK72_021051 [Caenorhabditis remanei]|uniref:F-box domain-containing protein n=1 Tax=Caenorhabditis remanei TaxID=31234 RepID=A0A6A5GH28_CAERE|nr:hypothetical protein GCK72_021051 [Caenorhabditis remanei]KAF1754488.1 hypothetical protein GCK72_021051 [Caenorhabditis remanei]
MNQQVAQRAHQFLCENSNTVKMFIFFEAVRGVPPYEAYMNTCGMFGSSDYITYQEFEFWFMRFSSREFAMEHDRSEEDPKPRTLMQLPMEILDKIAKELDLMDRMVLQKVNQFFRNFIVTWNPGFSYISLIINEDSSTLWLDNYHIQYRDGQVFDGFGIACRVSSEERRTKNVQDCGHVELAVRDMLRIAEHPKTKLEKLLVDFRISNREFVNRGVEALFHSQNYHQIHTKTVEIVTHSEMGEMAILPKLKPEPLSVITLDMNGCIRDEYTNGEEQVARFTAISELDQCKQADFIELKTERLKSEDFPIERFADFKAVSLHFKNPNNPFQISDFLKWRRILLLPTTKLPWFEVKSSGDISRNTFVRKLGKSAIEVKDREGVRHCKIPKTNDYLEVDFSRFGCRDARIVMAKKSYDDVSN